MTRYTVTWPSSVQDELAELWLSDTNWNSISAAANVIDSERAVDAAQKGIELGEGLRVFFAFPLRVVFAVRHEDRVVEVLRVARL